MLCELVVEHHQQGGPHTVVVGGARRGEVTEVGGGQPSSPGRRRGAPTRGRTARGARVFLGIVYRREKSTSVSFEEVTAVVRPVIRTSQIIDLRIVYEARTVVEVIEHLFRQRRELPSKRNDN